MLLGNIAQHSETLVEERESAVAAELWDTVRRYIPEKMLKGEVLLSMLNAYWSAQDSSANVLADRKISQLNAETEYYFHFPANLRKYVETDLESATETLLHIAMLAKKHKQEEPLMSVIDGLTPYFEQLIDNFDRKLHFYFSSDDPLSYEDEIGDNIDKLQMLYELLNGVKDVQHTKMLSGLLKKHIENYQNL